jgi:predicted N-acetyltransferase YhbS
VNGYIIPLNRQYQPIVKSVLENQEPWNMIAFEAFLTHGLENPQHLWFGEFYNNELVGIIYSHKKLLDFIYIKPPYRHSPLIPFIHRYFPSFITHGKKAIVEPILQSLSYTGLYDVHLHEKCDFVCESNQTEKVLQENLNWPSGIQIRTAFHDELTQLLQLFKGSDIEKQIDPSLITDLVHQKRMIIAQKNQRIIGSIMKLKETLEYSLIGGLFVHRIERNQGLATLLGQFMIQDCFKQGKKVCFYYSDADLKSFYKKGAFISIGEWVSYSTSKKVM